MKPGRTTLLRARCRALDPGDALELAAEGVAVDAIAPVPAPPSWRVVPPFLPRIADVRRVDLHLSADAPRPGDRVRFAVPRPSGDPVLVLLEGPDWHVVFPSGPGDVVTASALDGDATHVWVDLVVPGVPVPRLAGWSDPPDWRLADPWALLRVAVATGAPTYPLTLPEVIGGRPGVLFGVGLEQRRDPVGG